jgi:hypothetical protein
MKKGLFLLILMWGFQAAAAPVCATKKSELNLVQSLFKKVNLFGTWEGVWDGSPFKAKLYLNTALQIRGTVNFDGTEYGPTNVKICDDNGSYFLVVYSYEVDFDVISKKQIKGYSPFDEKVVTVLTKK